MQRANQEYNWRMLKPRRNQSEPAKDPLGIKHRKAIPHEFVLDALAELGPRTNPMFGCLAVYVKEKIVLILRDKPASPADNGVWLATTEEHHESLRRDFPNMRSIKLLDKKVTGWQVLPVDAPDFEESSRLACELILAGNPRIGKIPGERRRSAAQKRKSQKQSKSAKSGR
jgi:hypothetical protein